MWGILMRKLSSIRNRILRLALISVGVAVFVLSAVLVIQLDYVSTRAYESEVKMLTNSYATIVQNSADNIRMQIELAANNEIINTETAVPVLKEELSKLASTTNFQDFSIAETNGKTMNSTDISDREYFIEARDNGKTYISRPVIRKTDGSMVIMVATPMPNGKILYGAIDSGTLSAGLTADNLGENGIVYIVDKYNDVMACSDHSLIGETIPMEREFSEGARELDGNLYAYFLPIAATDGWSIIVIGNTSDAHSVVSMCLMLSIPLSIILCIIALIVALKISKNIVNPIRVTTKRLEDLASGDLNSEVEVFQRRDETETLSLTLKSVCETLALYVNNIVDIAEEMSNGDFSYSKRIEYAGDLSSIPRSFEKIHSMLKTTIVSLSESSKGVNAGTAQIANGAQLLAEGTARQATAVDELSVTLTNISDGVTNTANNAVEANSLSVQCAQLMQEQDAVMEKLLQAMTTIEEKSNAISGIIASIEEIAFQTNILALNASIEAAHAGDAGRGFAVVASEVGKLAGHSSESANSSKELLESTFEAIKNGSELVNEMANAVNEVKELSNKSASLIGIISEDSEKQAEALKEASVGVDEISRVIQQNSATAEESAASCEELNSQANVLSTQVANLKA